MRRLQIAAAALLSALVMAGVVYAAGASAPPATAPPADVIAGLGLAPGLASAAPTAACECPAGSEAPRAIVLQQVLANQADLKAQYDALIEELRASGDLTEAGAKKMQEAFAKMHAAPAPLALTMPAQPALAPEALMELQGQVGTLSAPGAEGLKLFQWKGDGSAPHAFAFKNGELDEELSQKIEAEVAEALKAAGVADGQALELKGLSGLSGLSADQQAKIEAEVAEALKAAGVADGQAIELERLGSLKELEGLKDLKSLKELEGLKGLSSYSLSSDELAKIEAELSKVLEETLPQLEERLRQVEEELAKERAAEPKDS